MVAIFKMYGWRVMVEGMTETVNINESLLFITYLLIPSIKDDGHSRYDPFQI